MKYKLLTLLALLVLSSGCVTYVQHPNVVRVQVRPPTTVVTVQTPRVVHVHRHVRRATRHVHHHHVRTRTTARSTERNRNNRRHHRQRTRRRHHHPRR